MTSNGDDELLCIFSLGLFQDTFLIVMWVLIILLYSSVNVLLRNISRDKSRKLVFKGLKAFVSTTLFTNIFTQCGLLEINTTHLTSIFVCL